MLRHTPVDGEVDFFCFCMCSCWVGLLCCFFTVYDVNTINTQWDIRTTKRVELR